MRLRSKKKKNNYKAQCAVNEVPKRSTIHSCLFLVVSIILMRAETADCVTFKIGDYSLDVQVVPISIRFPFSFFVGNILNVHLKCTNMLVMYK